MRRDSSASWVELNHWLESIIRRGVVATIDRRRRVTLHLPERMNFYRDYDATVLHIAAIRKFSGPAAAVPKHAFRLCNVNFDCLRQISTSAALVLTAELSKWDDAVRQRLRPRIDNWDPDILERFASLGFFDLFQDNPLKSGAGRRKPDSNIRTVRYIKGRCGDNEQARLLKNEIVSIVGDSIGKWTFLHSGLTEAITNVTHHAYPDEYRFAERDQNWYLTGAYNRSSNEIKIVFYDQGIGIPKSLPASDIWERVLEFLSALPLAARKRDEVLLRAAIALDRTRTDDTDRGRGLQDLLEFVRQRQNGYVSIMSLRGLYKLTVVNGVETEKHVYFKDPINGTLIIWNAALTN